MRIFMSDTSLRQAAIVAGTAILTMAIVAGFSYGFVLKGLVVQGDANATANNILASEPLFRSGVFGFLIVLICDVLAAWALFIFLNPANKSISLLAAWLRLVYTAMLGIAVLNYAIVLQLFSGADYLRVFEEGQLKTLALLFVNGFDGIWSIGLVVFGCHLFVLGYLVVRSGYIPKLIGVLLMVAAACYLGSNSANLLLTNYDRYKQTIESFLSVPMIVGELGFGLWLLFKGGKEHSADKILDSTIPKFSPINN